MISTHWDKVEWPDQSKIRKGKLRYPTLTFIQNLFNNVGVASSIIYALLVMVVKPILVKQFVQRCELSAETLIDVRKLVIFLQKKLNTTPIAVLGYNEQGKYVEHTTQTEEDVDATTLGKVECPLVRIKSKLQELNDDLDTFNKINLNRSTTNIDYFNLSTKLLVQEIKHADDTGPLVDQQTEIVSSIREIKGWFVSGKIR